MPPTLIELRTQAEVIPSLEAVSAHTVVELKAFLCAFTLPTIGNKATLAHRLWEFIHPPAPPEPPIPLVDMPVEGPADGLNLVVADAAPGVVLTSEEYDQFQQYQLVLNYWVAADPDHQGPPAPPGPP
jgi:hypothetical protein